MNIQTPADLTPLMRQYAAIKAHYKDILLFFQVGDFYELFFDDAKIASSFLGIALTKRGKVNGDPIPLCGVPVHALDHYLAKLVKGGFKVAICDQLEEPKPGKVVERGVTRVLTPGTLTDSKLLDEKSASYLFSFFPGTDAWGLLFAELLTAQLYATVLPLDSQKSLETELTRFFPDEIIIPHDKHAKPFEIAFNRMGYCTTLTDCQDYEQSEQWMVNQFSQDISSHVRKNESLRLALFYFYSYMRKTQHKAADQFKTLHWYKSDDYLILDSATQTNLELIKNNHDYTKKHTLFETLDGALTPMGSRMIKKWIMRPLVKKVAITQRHDVIELFVTNIVVMQQLEQLLSECGDIERVIGRIALHRAQLFDFCHLKRVLQLMPSLITLLHTLNQTIFLTALQNNAASFQTLYQLLESSLSDDATKDWIIKTGFDAELDQLRDLAIHGTQKIIELEAKEQQLTGINSLKIRYNQIHGYYIEVTKTHADSIPERYIRQQTLVGRERYITIELQQLQQAIIASQTQTSVFEKEIFERIKNEVTKHITGLRKLSYTLATLDALLGFARKAYSYNYVRPVFNENQEITIIQGRHPIVERVMDHAFIPNDTNINNTESTWIITGPNMGGKSTYLRQVALMNIMAQIGSFVPAKQANVPLLDRVFTRIGAGDNLAHGKSTFLVEMEETASICTQATSKSLVILDEVGRGTSTFDGLAIAQAVVEYIHTNIKARCLFATHYHELTQLPNQFPGIVNYYAACKKTDTGIQFLYTIISGIANGSFGLEVAKLAQLPMPVITRANTILKDLQSSCVSFSGATHDTGDTALQLQNTVTHLQQELHQLQKKLAALEKIDYENLSPKAAFDLLWKLKELS